MCLKEIEFESELDTQKAPFKSDELKEQLGDFQVNFSNCYDLERWRKESLLYQSFAEEQRKNTELEEEIKKKTISSLRNKIRQGRNIKELAQIIKEQRQKAKKGEELADEVLKSWDENYQLKKELQISQKENAANSQLIKRGTKYVKKLEKENSELVQKYNDLVDLTKEGIKRMTEKDSIISQQQWEIEKLAQTLENENEVVKNSQKETNLLGLRLEKKEKILAKLEKKLAKKNIRWEEKNASHKISSTKLKDQVEFYRERERESKIRTSHDSSRNYKNYACNWLTNRV